MHASRIRVLIADDHPIIADGIQVRLETSLLMQVVGVASSFAETLSMLQTIPTDVLVLDLTGMRGSPNATISHIRRHHAHVAIVVFSSIISLAPELLAAGVLGYVVKEDLASHLAHAIHAAYHGQTYLSPTVQQYVDSDGITIQLQHFTPKEHNVLELLDQGFKTLEIAEQMGIDPRCVQNYITDMNRKLHVNSRHLLIEWYRRMKQAASPSNS